MSAGAAPTVERVEVFFDFTCEFSNRARHWLDGLECLEVSWRPFSLLEVNRHDDSGPVFTRPEHADNVSLVALAVFEAVLAGGGDIDGYRRRMFSAWHDEHERYGRLSAADILGFGETAGMDGFDHDTTFARVASEHAAGVALGVFGTPTVVFGEGRVAFVKLDAPPDRARADTLWRSVRDLATGQPSLREWQRVSPSGVG